MDLKQYRKSLGLTQTEAGGRLGITKQSWYNLEKNWPDISMSSLLSVVQHLGAPIIIDVPGGARFAKEGEIVEDARTQDELNEAHDYLPDVLVGKIAERFNAHQSNPDRHPFTCCSPNHINRCTRNTGKSDGILRLDDNVPTCPCGLQHSIDVDSLAMLT